jgi:type VI protein secretion system component Hcp
MTEEKDTREQNADDAQEDLELEDDAAEKIAGGKIPMSELTVQKVIDKTTPSL